MVNIVRRCRKNVALGDATMMSDIGYFSFSSPFSLFFDNSSGTGTARLLITGYDGEKNRTTEFVDVVESFRSFSKNSYSVNESIEMTDFSGDAFKVTVSKLDGAVLCSVGRTNAASGTQHYISKEPKRVIGYGASGFEKETHTPAHLSLIAYDGKERVIHSMYVTTNGGICEKSFADLSVEPGTLLFLRVLTEGMNADIDCWLEVEQ